MSGISASAPSTIAFPSRLGQRSSPVHPAPADRRRRQCRPRRRTWWLAVGHVAGTIAAVKAGSTVHAEVLGQLEDAAGAAMGLVMPAAAALAFPGALWFLSRTERPDRRPVLGVFALYAAASAGLSAVSSGTAGAFGLVSNWAAAATFL